MKNLLIGCLKKTTHPSHASLDQIMDYIKYIQPEKVYLTHMTGLMDYDEIINNTPENVEPAYDGLEIIMN